MYGIGVIEITNFIGARGKSGSLSLALKWRSRKLNLSISILISMQVKD